MEIALADNLLELLQDHLAKLHLNSCRSDRPKVSISFIHSACVQTQTKRFFERLALQAFQKISCGSFDRLLP